MLDQINLTIEPGQMIGIIGSTGCGKTTLVSMIPRLYDVDVGKVLVDGIDVRDYSESSAGGCWHGAAENVLFSGTIEENLQWGDEMLAKTRFGKQQKVHRRKALFKTGRWITIRSLVRAA